MKTIKDLSREIGLNYAYLISFIAKSDKMYFSYYILKASGKLRVIDSPNFEMKAIQAWILRNVLEDIPISDRAMGFVKGKSIKNNARLHLHSKFVLTIDISNFFNTIKFGQVKGIFDKRFKNAELSKSLTKLCTFKKYLPQGAVSSPTISNIIFKPIDDEIEKLCNKKNVNYSRYADDLSFSSNDILKLNELYLDLVNIIKKYKFSVNKRKTRYLTGKNRIQVTGLILNSGRLTIGRNRKRLLRAKLYSYFSSKNKTIDKKVLLGELAFLRDIEPNYYKIMIKYKNRLKLKFAKNKK